MVLIDQFASYQRARGFSSDTIKRRTTTLRQFRRLIAPSDFAEATESDIQEFLLRYRSPRTRHAYRSDLATFYKWGVRRNLLPSNPCDLIDPIKVPRPLPKPVPAELIPLLVAAAPDSDLQLMIGLAAFAGLRVGEIAALDTDDVNMVRNVITVRNGKGGKDRTVPVHPLLRNLLIPYVQRPGRVFDVRKETIGRRMAAYLHAQGLRATAHKLRATFATEAAIGAEGNITMVQHLLGHSSPTTTMAYVDWNGGESAAVVDAMYAAG